MNKKAYKALEYYKIIDLLTDKASSPWEKISVGSLPLPQTLKRSGPCSCRHTMPLHACSKKAAFPSAASRTSAHIKTSYCWQRLNAPELLSVCSLLENTGRVKAYSRSDRDDGMTDSLDGMFAALEPLTPLSTEIRRCILSEDEISDDASSTLRQIRRSIKATNDRIHTQLSSLVAGTPGIIFRILSSPCVTAATVSR